MGINEHFDEKFNTEGRDTRPFRIGLTGGIATGKTTTTTLFAKLGIPIIDADVIAKSLTTTGHPNLATIQQHFGHDILTSTGELDRAQLRQLIMHDPQANHWLKQLLHPQIQQKMLEQASLATSAYCILVIPLLAESTFDYQLDRVCVVDAPVQVQLSRLQQRDQHTAAEAQSLAKLQASREERLQLADDIITNDGDHEHLLQQVNALHNLYLQLANDHK